MTAEMFKDLIERMKEQQERESISGHYGFSDDWFDETVNNILCDMIKCKQLTDVLDKHFKSSDAEHRLKVQCYSAALTKFFKLSEK